MADLTPGIYEHLRTRGLDNLIQKLPDQALVSLRGLDIEDSHEVLARHLAGLIRKALCAAGDNRSRIDMANRVVDLLTELVPGVQGDVDLVAAPEELLAVAARRVLGGEVSFPPRPTTPMSASALLMNGRKQPQIGHELMLELATADNVDLLCAFVKWNGIRLLESAIEQFCRRGGTLRVLTSTYLGATDGRAVRRLAELGAQVRVSYETKMTRLHAKAWLFRRRNGLTTAYVGSSNLSRTALSHGLEWNVRLADAEQPHLIQTFATTFDDYWRDAVFEEFDPERDGDRLEKALGFERRGEALTIDFATLDVKPYPYQQEVLDELETERVVHGHNQNLVVMATGTGKTIVAALDYRRLRATNAVESLLFVAHREDILQQSRLTFAQVLRDSTFGELFVGGKRPSPQARHVFASIQSLHRQRNSGLDPQAYDMLIVDEFHHAEADTYQDLLRYLRPKILLGLTATPERTDGKNVKDLFGGRTPVELRLWEALERGLLAPFQYFGVHDGTNLSLLPFNRKSGYDPNHLTRVYTADNQRVALVLETLNRKVTDVAGMRGIGFCVDIAHAQFMAEHFQRAGVPAVAVTSDPKSADRVQALKDLRAGKIKIVFAVDIFNEGVDVPEIDTVLFLRPTDSATIFLQQLGRGLRLSPGKDCLTVLDFVGHQHRSFRFDRRLRAVTGLRRTQLADEIEKGFASLPPGCAIDLDRDVREMVLKNVRQTLQLNWKELAGELRLLGDVPLPTFLVETGLDLDDLYRRGRGWLALKRAAGFAALANLPDDDRLGRAFGRMLHLDDPERLEFITKLLAGKRPAGPRERRSLIMFDAAVWGGTQAGSQAESRLHKLLRNEARCDELGQLVIQLREGMRRITQPIEGSVPLHLHARYTKNEALAAYGVDKPASWQAGVRRIDRHKADLFFVTINKVEGHYSPTTMYHDVAIAPDLFQWETQGQTGIKTPTAQRYINHASEGNSVHLFLRESKRDEGLGAPPYLYAGPMRYVSHERDRPVRFLWKLDHALPPDVFHYARATAG